MKGSEPHRRAWTADLARFAGALSLPVIVLDAVGTRTGYVPEEAYIAVLSVGFGLAVAALAIGLFALSDIWQSGADGAEAAIGGIVTASPALLALVLVAAAAVFYPRLTDVSTDQVEPPMLAVQRADQPVRDERDVAVQAEAYPELIAHVYPLPAPGVFDVAKTLMEERGWEIVTASPPAATASDDFWDDGEPLVEGYLQAVAPTLAFGFPEDIVVRIRATPADGAAVDMRSASRVGQHDLGQNARRIRWFLADLDRRLQEAAVRGPPAAAPAPAAAPSEAEAPPPEGEASAGQ